MTTHTPNYVNPETRVPELFGVQIALTSWSFLVVSARLYTRASIVRGFGADDIAIVIALVMAIVESTLACMASKWGTGLHLWDIPPDLPLASSLKVSFAAQILYMPILLLTKLSILLFYFRLSPNNNYRKTVWTVMGISILFGLSVTIASIFQCTPVAYFYDTTLEGKCINQELFLRSTAIINIINDFGIFILPLPIVWKLKLPTAQKAALWFIISMGVFVCISSIIRLTYLFRLSQSNDVTWYGVDLSNWSCIEYNTGIVCASLSVLRPLIVRYLPSVFGPSITTSNGIRSGRKYNGSISDRTKNYRGIELGNPEYNAVVVGRGREGKDNESKEHIIAIAYNQESGITKTMDVTVDISDRIASSR